MQISAVVSKERYASLNYVPALPKKYCMYCFEEAKDSDAQQCNDCEGKISKSELCTGTAEEVMFLLCFRNEGSGAKQCSGFEGKISKS